MKSFISYLVLLSFITNPGWARTDAPTSPSFSFQNASEDVLVIEGGVTCDAEIETEEETPDCNTNPNSLSNLTEDSKKIIGPNYQYPECNSADFKEFQSKNSTHIVDLEKQLKNECEDEFRAKRNELSKELLKDFRLFAALKVRMKRAKKHANSGTRKHDLEDKSNDVSDLDFNKAVDEWKKETEEKFAPYQPSYKQSLKKKWSMSWASYGDPIILFKGTHRTCEISKKSNYLKNPYTPPPVLSYPAVDDMKGDFPDDCSVLVSNKMNFKKAHDYIRSEYSGDQDVCDREQRLKDPTKYPKDGFRQAELDNGDKAEKKLNDLADQFVKSNSLGYTPKFSINVSRNDWDDDTKELAKKRGEFSSAYLLSSIQEKLKAKGEELPLWATNMDEFKKVVTVNELTYGDNEKGTYGPKPKSKSGKKSYTAEYTEEEQVEVAEYEAQLKKERNEFESQINDETNKLSNLKLAKEKADKEIKRLQSEIGTLKKSKEVDENTAKQLDTLSQQLKEQYLVSTQVEYESLTTEKRKVHLEKQKKTYTDNYITGQRDLLKQFYSSDLANVPTPGDLMGNKHHWDAKLFNQFKKVEIVGEFTPTEETESELNYDFLPPSMKDVIRARAEAFHPYCEFGLSKKDKNKRGDTGYNSGVSKREIRKNEKRAKDGAVKPCRVKRSKKREVNSWVNGK